MIQTSLFTQWAGPENHYVVDRETEVWECPLVKPFDALWTEYKCAKRAQDRVRPYKGHKLFSRWTREDRPVFVRQAGRFVCERFVPTRPLRKLCELEQLPKGRTILWNPEATSDQLRAAKLQAAWMRKQGRGEFRWERRGDGSLWVTRTAANLPVTYEYKSPAEAG